MKSAGDPNRPKPDPDVPKYEIETERLLFRRMLESDCESLHEVYASHDAMTYMSRAPHADIARTISFIEETLSPAHAEDYYFTVCLKSSSPALPPQPIGTIGTIKDEIGYVLHPAHWRKGVASEAMEGFLKSFWEAYPEVECITADADPRNNASLRLLGKFGFVETGRESNTFDTHIGLCDSVYLRLNRPTIVSG